MFNILIAIICLLLAIFSREDTNSCITIAMLAIMNLSLAYMNYTRRRR